MPPGADPTDAPSGLTLNIDPYHDQLGPSPQGQGWAPGAPPARTWAPGAWNTHKWQNSHRALHAVWQSSKYAIGHSREHSSKLAVRQSPILERGLRHSQA